VNRRDTIGALLAIAAAPLAAHAQQTAKISRIGLLSSFAPTNTALWYKAFLRGLRELGWVEGKNIGLEYRYTKGRTDRLHELAADFVRLNVDIIVAAITPEALAAKSATKTIPIVVASMGDPVELGLVESLARPGGNLTGLTNVAAEQAGKRLELLKEIIPKLSRVAVLWDPQNQTSRLAWKEIQLPARQLGVQLHSLEVRSPDDFDRTFKEATKVHAGALVTMPGLLFVANLKLIADFAARSRMPSLFHLREFADAGGLVAYGADRADLFRRAATYVDKILKGAKPADLPIQQPNKFDLVINLKTAKQLGIEIPMAVLFRADEVIE